MATAHPRHYRIRLEPDMERFCFSGTASILFSCDVPLETLTLNVLDLAVWKVRFRTENTSVDLPFSAW